MLVILLGWAGPVDAAIQAPVNARIKDVAKVQLDALSYTSFANNNGNPAVSMGIFQTPGSNARNIINDIKAYLNDAEKTFQIVRQKYPNHPAGKFFDAMIDWWKITLDTEIETYDDKLSDLKSDIVLKKTNAEIYNEQSYIDDYNSSVNDYNEIIRKRNLLYEKYKTAFTSYKENETTYNELINERNEYYTKYKNKISQYNNR